MRARSVIGLTIMQWLARRLGLERASTFGCWIGRTIGPRTGRHTRVVRNLERALPGLDTTRRTAIADEMWGQFGRTVAESLLLDRIAADPSKVLIANSSVLDAEAGERRGTVFVGLHFGNWEVTVLAAGRAGQQPIGLYKPLADKAADAWLRASRVAHYPGGLLPATRGALLSVARHVRKGGAVCLLGDHRDAAGLDVQFFGAKAPSTALPGMLAVRYGARLFATRVERRAGERFLVHLHPIPIVRTGDEAADIRAATAETQAVFQRWIEADPAQWLWFYKRWSSVD